MAVALDSGKKNIHPSKKKVMADRFLFIAFHETYGFSTVDFDTLIYKSQEVKEGGLLLSFKNARSELNAYNELADFEIVCNDKLFYPAKASMVKGKLLFVSSLKVPNSLAVRTVGVIGCLELYMEKICCLVPHSELILGIMQHRQSKIHWE